MLALEVSEGELVHLREIVRDVTGIRIKKVGGQDLHQLGDLRPDANDQRSLTIVIQRGARPIQISRASLI